MAVDEQNAPLVVSICRRLDGLPLAIELAAARLRSLSLGALNDRLDRRFGLLTVGSRTAPARQQTLHAAVDWSYAQLHRACTRGMALSFEQAIDLTLTGDLSAT